MDVPSKISLIKLHKFILHKYNIPINICILEKYLNNFNKEKKNILNIHFEMIFGLNFQNLLKLSINTPECEYKTLSINLNNPNSIDTRNKTLIDNTTSLLIKNYLITINEKGEKIRELEEANEDLRTNYWNLKQSTLNKAL